MPESLSFFSQGARLAGTLWKSSTPSRAPAVIVMGSWTTVKEQMPANYAPLFAQAGYVVLTFDFRRFGKSEGDPRDVESAHTKAEDIRNAAAFLRTHDAVHPDRIGAVPICASAGYTALALAGESPLRSVAMIAPWLHNAEIVRSLYGEDDAVQQRIDRSLAAREHYASSAKVEYVPAASATDKTAAMNMPADQLDYYLNPERGAIPEWSGRFATMAWKEWLEFDPIALAPQMKLPMLLVTGGKTATPGGAQQFGAGLQSLHEIVALEGTQFDFYDKPETVAAAAQHAIEFLRSTLR